MTAKMTIGKATDEQDPAYLNQAWQDATARASDWVAKSVGKDTPRSAWKWTPLRDSAGQLHSKLTVTYRDSTAEGTFTDAELKDESEVRHRVFRLWNRALDGAWKQFQDERLKRSAECEAEIVAA